MPTRIELQNKIAKLDEEINAELEKTKVPELNPMANQFPMGAWGITAFLFAWWLFGEMILPGVHAKTGPWDKYLAFAFLVISILRTLLFVMKSNKGVSKGYRETTEHVRALQDERRELKKQLKELDEG